MAGHPQAWLLTLLLFLQGCERGERRDRTVRCGCWLGTATCICPMGLGHPCPSGQLWGLGLGEPSFTVLNFFNKGNILFLYIFINSAACTLAFLYSLSETHSRPAPPLPVSHFSPFSLSRAPFPQHLPRVPPLCPLCSPSSAAEHVQATAAALIPAAWGLHPGSGWPGHPTGQGTGLEAEVAAGTFRSLFASCLPFPFPAALSRGRGSF